ncbi:hypothetical protein [Rhodoferax sp.]|uniref:hypothetical protein n=1 Tax=Rhodoferax sp. TaxID=50421 RepID=UPI00374D86BB
MGIASFSSIDLLGSFHGLVGWFTATGSKPQAQHKANAARPSLALRPGPSRSTATCVAHHPAAPLRPLRPLRVLRVVDTAHTAASAGRMVISGRMADVCAELDRLAALEAMPRQGALLQ